MSNTVHVEGISSQTSEKDVRDFFSFCGKITSLSLDDASGSKKATVTFEKESAAKTALLLDSTQLGPAQVHVTAGQSLSESTGHKGEDTSGDHEVTQDDKPRSRIFAEYLAHGYVISDKAIEQAIALDQQHGISSRFTNALKSFDGKYQATQKAQAVDDKYAVTAKANNAWNGLYSYFDKATSTPTGQKLRQFYVDGAKQVLDVHAEARHLANLKSGKTADSTGPSAPAPSASALATETAQAAEEKIPVDTK